MGMAEPMVIHACFQVIWQVLKEIIIGPMQNLELEPQTLGSAVNRSTI